MQFLGSRRISGTDVLLRFRVLFGGSVAVSAQVSTHWKADTSSGALEDKLTNEDGVAETPLTFPGGETELEVRARLDGRETVRRFLIRSAKA